MSSNKSFSSQPYSPQFTPKTPKSFNPQVHSPQPYTPMSYNPQIHSPQPFTPLSYNSQMNSPQPFTPMSYNSQVNSPQPFTPMSYNSQVYSPQPFTPLYSSRPTTPKRPKTPNQFPQRSLNNSPFEPGGSYSNYTIHHSNSTSKIYTGPNSHDQKPLAVGTTSNGSNSLYPPNYPHKNKKSAVKVYQHTRKVVNDDNNEAVEVSEVTQQLYQINGSELKREEASLYSFTTYTNDNKKKIKHTKSNMEIQSILSDSSSGSEATSPQMKKGKKEVVQQPRLDIYNRRKPIIESIPSQGSLEEKDNSEKGSPEKYNIPLNDTTNRRASHRKYSSDHGKYNGEYDYSSYGPYGPYGPNGPNGPNGSYSSYGSYSSNGPNPIQNKNVNPPPQKNSTPKNENLPVNHRKHYSDYGRYTYNASTAVNYTDYEENPINIVIRNPDNEEIYRENVSNVSSPKSSYSVFSTTFQKTSNVRGGPGSSNGGENASVNLMTSNTNNGNGNGNSNGNPNLNSNVYLDNEENVSNFSQSQTSALNSTVFSPPFESQTSEYDQTSDSVTTKNGSVVSDAPVPYLYNNYGGGGRKKHKTTTTTTTTYEIIEDIDDDEEEEILETVEGETREEKLTEEEINEELNQHTIEKYEKVVHFGNFPFPYRRPTSYYNNRGLLPAPSNAEVITDKETLSQQINLRKSSWHTSFFENRGRPSSSMFSIPRYQPDRQASSMNKFKNNSMDSLEDKTCYHILYQFDKEDFIVRLGKALYLYGSPTFRTECTLRSVSKLLGLQGEFASFPTLILLSFSNYSTNDSLNSESHLLLTPTGYDLGKLEEVVQITYELKKAIKSLKKCHEAEGTHCKISVEESDEEGEEGEIKRDSSLLNNSKQKQEKKGGKKKGIKKYKLPKKKKAGGIKDKDKDKDKEKTDEEEVQEDDSVMIEIEKSNSITDVNQISRKRNSRTTMEIEEEYENDITVYSMSDLRKNIKNSKTTLSNEEVDQDDNEITYDGKVEEPNDNENENDSNDDPEANDKYQNIDDASDISIEKSEKVALTTAINKLDYVIAKPRAFGSVPWQLASYILAGATASPILFGGTWLDVVVSGIAGLVVGLITYYEPSFFRAHSHLVEFLASLGASATLRIIQGIFPNYCVNFTADILSAVLYHLPGLNFTIGFIELASRNMISGTVRLMHSLVTSFMMGAGITIGVHITKFITVPIVLDTTTPQSCEAIASPSTYWYILMFPLLSFSLNMMFFANAYQFPIMLCTTFISYIVTIIGGKLNLPNEIAIIIAAMAVGIVSNIYAKIRKRLAIIPIIIGVLLLVPGSVGVKGSLAFLIDQNFETGVQFTISMFTVSMWITIGVFLSNLIVFPFKNSENMGLMTL